MKRAPKVGEPEPTSRSITHLIYALISLVCPFVAYAITYIYQEYAHYEFRQGFVPGDDASVHSAALMALVEFFQMGFFVFIGCCVGIIFAMLSLLKKRRFLSFGLAALLFNGAPVVLLLFWYKHTL
jgi:hypothetical protein